MNALRYLPATLKETVTIQRPDAYERNVFSEVAREVLCYIRPGNDITLLRSGVPVSVFGFNMKLDVPIPGIREGDHVIRADNSRLTVYRVRPHRDVMMSLILRSSDGA